MCSDPAIGVPQNLKPVKEKDRSSPAIAAEAPKDISPNSEMKMTAVKRRRVRKSCKAVHPASETG